MALTKEAREFFAKEGRRGAQITNSKKTAKQRKESAQKAARARWAKKGKPSSK